MRAGPLLLLVAAVVSSACRPAEQPGPDVSELARRGVEAAITGTWKLERYEPEQSLSGALLLAIAPGTVMVRFEGGRIRGASPGLTFDRAYRLDPPLADSFRGWLRDEQGLEYEIWGRFDGSERLLFESRTEPWRGRGSFVRVSR